MKFDFVKMAFGDNPIHLSDGRGRYYYSEDILHSDTLKNAIFISAGRLFGSDALKEDFYDSFIISSALPWMDDEYFFPCPLLTLPLRGLSLKDQKKIRFVGKSIFEQFLTGAPDFKNHENWMKLEKGAFVSMTLSREKKVFNTQAQDRVSLQKETPQPYYMDQLRLQEGAGLFFMVTWDKKAKEEHKLMFKQCLEWLADEGIGSDKTYGFGRFELIRSGENNSIHQMDLTTPGNAEFQISIGLYRPSYDDQMTLGEDLPMSGFLLLTRGGYLADAANPAQKNWRKHSARFFDIGSVFPYRETRAGEKIDLRPKGVNHPVWREGKTIFLPVNAQYVAR